VTPALPHRPQPGHLRLSAGWLLLLLVGLTAAGAAEPPEIRVLLAEGEPSVAVAGELEWSDTANRLGATGGSVTVAASGQAVVVRIDGSQRYATRLTARAGGGYATHAGTAYRGRLEFFVGKAGGVVVLNVLPLEDYLPGTVPSEMPPSWPPEALRAQAVASRTYAVSRMAAQRDATFDVAATVADQVYRGVAGEDDRTTAAVRATAGQIMTYLGVPITAYFSSDAGGYTRAGQAPYLQPVPAETAESPYRDWSFELSAAELSELAAAAGVSIGTVSGCTAAYDQVSGHLTALTIAGSSGEAVFTGPQLRRYVGRDVMRSTLVRIEPLGSSSVQTAAAPASLTPPPASGAHRSAATATLEAYTRPWVADGEQESAVKMRRMFAYDGDSLLQCNRTVYIVAGELGFDQPASSPAADVREAITAPAGSFSGILVRGSGYGHGVGMSQWGARQLAQDGLDYAAILLHFYTGVRLDQWDGLLAVMPESPEHGFYQPFEVVEQ